MIRTDIRGWYRARAGYWFRPKLFGWGAVPVTWQGWLSIVVLIALALPVAFLIERFGIAWSGLLAPLVMGFVWLSWAKTDGEWRWRWGRD